ncbi:hypothetical protein QM467_02790 [Rhodoblastus sp. 17X3]|uniref:hypothetical protein n=1 Tax=Rhodoblastus sp. 17X3 TaxID=3047026 RepID=UPI0024B703F8|nr:hypothetical protein [Rhodoblastus sp. 17X3]MDI9846984.1 hypothetical protein [Rhodoblastus sp. 17X3]
MRKAFQRILTFHWLTTFLLMGVFSFLGALASVNIFVMLDANVRFLSAHGAMAVMEGALTQLGQLLASGLFALAMYLGFKACERVLVEKILEK